MLGKPSRCVQRLACRKIDRTNLCRAFILLHYRYLFAYERMTAQASGLMRIWFAFPGVKADLDKRVSASDSTTPYARQSASLPRASPDEFRAESAAILIPHEHIAPSPGRRAGAITRARQHYRSGLRRLN